MLTRIGDMDDTKKLFRFGFRYNELLSQVNREDVSDYERERITRIQRRVAKHWRTLFPEGLKKTARQAFTEPDAMTEYDSVPLDGSTLSVAIQTGETWAAAFERTTVADLVKPEARRLLDLFFERNAEALDAIVGFECARKLPSYFHSGHPTR